MGALTEYFPGDCGGGEDAQSGWERGEMGRRINREVTVELVFQVE